jgi:glycosyltransferase involved in cell wall biosynthesis
MKNEKSPLVSVLMPVYNGDKYIKEAIQSLLEQTYSNFEIIVIDDGSNDNTQFVVENEFSDSRIHYIRNEKNLGNIENMNKGLNFCHGKYIARMDQDDIALPQRFEKQVALMEDDSSIVLCGTSLNRFSTEYSIIDNRGGGDEKMKPLLMFDTAVNHPSSMFRRSVLIENNLKYPLDYLYAEDYGLWYQLSKYGKIVNLPDILLRYRMHGSNLSMKFNASQFDNMSKVRLIVLSDFLNKTNLTDSEKQVYIDKYKYFLELAVADFDAIQGFETFLQQIFTLNEQYKIYDSDGLRTAAAWFWYVVFVHGKCKKYKWKMIFSFLLNKKSICSYVTKPERKKFFVKSLLCWKVK